MGERWERGGREVGGEGGERGEAEVEVCEKGSGIAY